MKNSILTFLLLLFTDIFYCQNEMSKKVSETFNIENRNQFDSIAKKLNYKAGDKIKVSAIFTVNENGEIVDIKARSVHKAFEQEAIRILNELPKMPVAMDNDKPISQTYALPIVFEIESEAAKKQRLKKEKRKAQKK